MNLFRIELKMKLFSEKQNLLVRFRREIFSQKIIEDRQDFRRSTKKVRRDFEQSR